MEIVEQASRALMSLLQDPFSSGKRQVTYASRSSSEAPQYASASVNQSVETVTYGLKDFSKYVSGNTGLPLTVLVLLSIIIIYPITKAIYNIYFHPLSKFPGPIFAAATKIPIALVTWDGNLSHWSKDLHEYYQSDVVRTSPDELSFIGTSAWKDIYGMRPAHERFQKDVNIFSSVDSILTASDADHSRIRRLLSHAFSDKALREQESLVQSHVDNLIRALQDQIHGPAKGEVNIKDWFNYTTFDVISDFSFGESFNCLEESRYQPWVAMFMSALKLVAMSSVAKRFPPLERLLKLYIPKDVIEARKNHSKQAAEKVEKRLNTETTRPDLLYYLQKHNEGGKEAGGMTREEIDKNAATLIGAGGETTAQHIVAAVYFLLTNPHCMENLLQEIRAFESKEDLNLNNLGPLQYYQAIIDETFRMFPPAVAGQARVAPKAGAIVSGYFVPGGTGVQLNQYAAFRSHLNFNSPDVFAPSRWLGNEHFAKDKRDVVQPFSIGARNCIGKNLALLEIRLILAHVLWHFDLELSEKTPADWLNQKSWLTWEKKPLMVKLKARKV